ncbi:MAG: hypothetical protein VW875_17910 [Planctomycetaceae bacterium]
MRQLQCPHCLATLNAPLEGGITLTCGACQKEFQTPVATAEVVRATNDPFVVSVSPETKRTVRRSSRSRKSASIWTTGAGVFLGLVCFVLLLIAIPFFIAMFDAVPKTITSRPNRVNAPPAPAYGTIYTAHDEMTDLQWGSYRKTLVGSRVDNWEGKVVEVRKKSFGSGTWIVIDMDFSDEWFDTAFVYLASSQQKALKWNKGERILFSGIITDASENLFDDLRIEIE